MEKRYGARQLSTMAANYLSESYKSDNAKPCPNCRAPIEKSDGCNKMTCFKCQGSIVSHCAIKMLHFAPLLLVYLHACTLVFNDLVQ